MVDRKFLQIRTPSNKVHILNFYRVVSLIITSETLVCLTPVGIEIVQGWNLFNEFSISNQKDSQSISFIKYVS